MHFFCYDAPKVLLLLTGIVFVMGIVQTFFAPERTQALLAGRRVGVGNALAALLGIITLLLVFGGAAVHRLPLRRCATGVTFSFLISAPMVNEVALVLLFGMFGWKVAFLYLGLGLAGGHRGGAGDRSVAHGRRIWGLGPADPERPARQLCAGSAGLGGALRGWPRARPEHRRQSLAPVLAGIGRGAGIHGYVPEDFMASFMGKDVWWAVPAAVLLGVPDVPNAPASFPSLRALLGKGPRWAPCWLS